MTRPFFENEAFRDEMLSKIKLGRLGQLEDLTGAIVFLASDASRADDRHVAGGRRRLDGGVMWRVIPGARKAREPGIQSQLLRASRISGSGLRPAPE